MHPLTYKKLSYSTTTFTLSFYLVVHSQGEPDTYPSPHSLQNIQFSDSDVLDILTTLDINKACGIDNFGPRIF